MKTRTTLRLASSLVAAAAILTACAERIPSVSTPEGPDGPRLTVTPTNALLFIDGGSTHACGLQPNGKGWCWGRNNYGQLGLGPSAPPIAFSPQSVDADVSFATVVAGNAHTCARSRDGRALCWGRNIYGQLGDGSTLDRSRPVVVRGGLSFSSLNASGPHTCGITAAGVGYCWGYNIDGQLGTGDRDNATVPAKVATQNR